MVYRREIDGLRALAVAPIIFYHAGSKTFSGGYVGVDVFFVISGYLITTIILEQLDRGEFSLLDFYWRRAKRILPALFFMVLICLPIAWYLLIPSEMVDFLRSTLALVLFAQNFYLWQNSGYFNAELELSPLMHTWSLAVEEQYYFLFPILMIILSKLLKKNVFLIVFILFVSSLCLAQFFVFRYPEATYYLLPTRAWELLMGSIVAMYLRRVPTRNKSDWYNELYCWLGLTLIVTAVFNFDFKVPVPSLFSLIPTIGATLIIIGAKPNTMFARVIGYRPIVFLGLISYSLYLWHQPIFAFARNFGATEPNRLEFVFLIILTLSISILSHKFIENPFRKKNLVSKKVFTFGLLTSLVLVLTISVFGIQNGGFRDRLPQNITWQSLGEKIDKQGYVCEAKPQPEYFGVNACEFGSNIGSEFLVLYGDSHADSLSYYLSDRLKQDQIRGVRVSLSGCGVVPIIIDSRMNSDVASDCAKKFSNLKLFVGSLQAKVIVVSRWSYSLYPVKGFIEDMPYRNSEGGVESEDYREYGVQDDEELKFDAKSKQSALIQFVQEMASASQQLYLVYPIPEIGWDVARLNWSHYRNSSSVLKNISIPSSDYIQRNSFVIKVFDSLDIDNLTPIKPYKVFCDSFIIGRCVAQINSIPLYYDDDHLSYVGSEYLVNAILKSLSN